MFCDFAVHILFLLLYFFVGSRHAGEIDRCLLREYTEPDEIRGDNESGVSDFRGCDGGKKVRFLDKLVVFI